MLLVLQLHSEAENLRVVVKRALPCFSCQLCPRSARSGDGHPYISKAGLQYCNLAYVRLSLKIWKPQLEQHVAAKLLTSTTRGHYNNADVNLFCFIIAFIVF